MKQMQTNYDTIRYDRRD